MFKICFVAKKTCSGTKGMKIQRWNETVGVGQQKHGNIILNTPCRRYKSPTTWGLEFPCLECVKGSNMLT